MLALASRSWKFSIWKYKTRQNSLAHTHSRAILMKSRHIAILCIVSLLKLSASKRVLIDSSQWDHSRTRPSTRIHEMWLHPTEKKEKYEQNSFLVSKKRERRGRCVMLCTKPPWNISSSITCTWPMRWASRFLRDTRFDLAIQMLWICNILHLAPHTLWQNKFSKH